MKKLLIATTVLSSFVIFANSASAADPIDMTYDWSGLYLGVHGGYGWSDIDRSTGAFDNSYEADGPFGGGQIGYNLQNGSFVFGAEIDASLTGIDGDDGGAGGTVDTTQFDYMAAANLRAGFAIDRVLLFATGGVALAGIEQSNNAVTNRESDSYVGWTVGAGADYAVSENIVLGVAYRYVDFGKENFNFVGLAPFSIDAKQQQVRFTASYKF